MHEYVTVSSSSYDPASLATKLTEKAAEGWTVVAIVPTGGDVTAFLSREGGAASSSSSSSSSSSAPAMEAAAEPMMAAASPAPEPEPAMAAMTPEPPAPSEPAGWAVAPEPAPAPVSTAPATVIQSAAPMADIGGGYSAPAAPAYQPAPAPAPATPSVPAGWYADPAGRFDLRYWDGATWTEHVSRAGQQYTDAPVA